MSSLSSFALPDAVARARRHSSFLAMLLDREPEIEVAALAGELLPPPVVAEDLPVGIRLRRERRALALTVALGDLSGLYDLTEVTHRLTDFADRSLDRAIRAAIEERTPGAEPVGFAAMKNMSVEPCK